MTFTEIIQSELTNLPLIRAVHNSYREFLFERLDKFNHIVQNSTDLSKKVNGFDFDQKLFKKRNRILIEGIKKTINSYYEGNPHIAFGILSRTIKDSNVIGYIDKNNYIPKDSNFFRIRRENVKNKLTKEQLFHIPFDKRELVSTQRYSIAGLPSLYLSNSIFVAWEELGRPSDNMVQAARIINQRELKLLDLTHDLYQKGHLIRGNEEHGWSLLYSVMIWPLIAACSVKVPEREVPFKPEYIIPQLLLQWINKTELDGIKYSSTQINTLINEHDGRLYNFVIPVKTFSKDIGLCKELVKLFKISEVAPLNANLGTMDGNVNKDLTGINLSGDRTNFYYPMTNFGKLEQYLKSLKAEEIPVANNGL